MIIGLNQTLDFVKKIKIEHPSNLSINSIDDFNKHFYNKIVKHINSLEKTPKTDCFKKSENFDEHIIDLQILSDWII